MAEPKFKIGDKVKLNPFKYPQYNGLVGIIEAIWHNAALTLSGEPTYSYDVKYQRFDKINIREIWIELVEEKKALYYGKKYYLLKQDGTFKELGDLDTYKEEGDKCIITFHHRDYILHLPKSKLNNLYTEEEKEICESEKTKPLDKKKFERL